MRTMSTTSSLNYQREGNSTITKRYSKLTCKLEHSLFKKIAVFGKQLIDCSKIAKLHQKYKCPTRTALQRHIEEAQGRPATTAQIQSINAIDCIACSHFGSIKPRPVVSIPVIRTPGTQLSADVGTFHFPQPLSGLILVGKVSGLVEGDLYTFSPNLKIPQTRSKLPLRRKP